MHFLIDNLDVAIFILSVGVSYVVIDASAANASRTLYWRRAFLALLLSYLFVVFAVKLFDHYLVWKMTTFDLNGDHVFTDSETTPELDYYSGKVVSDTGRSLILFTAILNAIVSVAVATLIQRGSKVLFNR